MYVCVICLKKVLNVTYFSTHYHKKQLQKQCKQALTKFFNPCSSYTFSFSLFGFLGGMAIAHIQILLTHNPTKQSIQQILSECRSINAEQLTEEKREMICIEQFNIYTCMHACISYLFDYHHTGQMKARAHLSKRRRRGLFN